MAYIGNTPAEAFSAFQKQDFSTSATTSYTLDHPVSNQNEIALFINFVRQEPTAAYTASGTTLTLTSATSSSDDMYCVYLGKAVQTVNPPSGSVGSSQVASTIITGQTAETSIATDDTVLIHDTSAGALRKMTRANFVSGVGGDLTPAFQVTKSSAQTVSHATTTKVTWDVETFDTNSAFASDKFTVPSGKDGKYFFYFETQADRSTDSDMYRLHMFLYKNGSTANQFKLNLAGTDGRILIVSASQALDLSAGDYIEIYVNTASSSTNSISLAGSSTETCVFGGYKLLGV